jgi:hypothetical protein
MGRAGRLTAGAGALVMALGALGPWATAHTRHLGTVAVGGLDQGSLPVLALSVLTLAAIPFAGRRVTVVLGTLALAWTALVGHGLPGDVAYNADAWQAEWAWGIYAALAGAAVVVTGAVAVGRRGA